MDSDGESAILILNQFIGSDPVPAEGQVIYAIIGLVLLLVISAFISGSEVAFFSIKGEDLRAVKEQKTSADSYVYRLLRYPKYLLATILITNNVVNIGIVILSTIITNALLHLDNQILEFLIQLVLVTFLLVLFGEVTPKIYAQNQNLRMARFMAFPMIGLIKFLKPISFILVKSSSFFEKRIDRYRSELSKEELHEAIELTSDEDTSEEEKNILKGIVNFGDTTVKQIMKPRHEVVAYSLEENFAYLTREINRHRYSRIPIFEDSLDKVVGVLHVKDLLPYLDQKGFKWTRVLRQPYFVPEMKKIDDLLREFQSKKVHMAIVVDEYGGTEGVVTLEDVLEEIVGEINDEFDDTEVFYSKLDERTVVFDGKTSLGDVQKVLNLEAEAFDEFKNDVESIGGLLVELEGSIPTLGTVVDYGEYRFTVESADKKRVRRIKMELIELPGDEEEEI